VLCAILGTIFLRSRGRPTHEATPAQTIKSHGRTTVRNARRR
jgi:hypothetical protein